ncbi:unnamed protein product [Coffea canephora]|uniref:Uncharacterized protein n=1 Tax=Coffea canephora TaxID=49390 RepID=A0A068VC20_COFCA|nr:unnamed protein product [Coffea canephora]
MIKGSNKFVRKSPCPEGRLPCGGSISHIGGWGWGLLGYKSLGHAQELPAFEYCSGIRFIIW